MADPSFTEDQVRYFRARRGLLVGPGASDPVACAETILGAQAQVESCAWHALSLRTQGNPTVSALAHQVLKARTLVRTWGQRGTLHLYARQALPLVAGARLNWATAGRRGGMPPEPLVADIETLFADAQGPLSRSDLVEHIPQTYVDQLADHPGAGNNPRRFAATRLIWVLAQQGVVVFAGKVGREQGYAHRDHWCPELRWQTYDPDEANAELARRYLRVFGPATLKDMAHHFGTTLRHVRRWSALLEQEVISCTCGQRTLLVMRDDVEALHVPVGDWPIRLMPAYDTVLMGHKDKQIILPNKAEEPLIWKKAAVVAAVVLARGRIVATWSHKRRTREVDVTLTPLSGWSSTMRGPVEAQARYFAAHLERTLGACEFKP